MAPAGAAPRPFNSELTPARGRGVGIDMKDAFSLFEHFNPGQTLPQRAKRISAGQYSLPSFEMSMARKI